MFPRFSYESRASPTCCPVTRGRGRKRKSVCVRAVVSLSAPCRNALKLPEGFVGGRFQRHREGERKPNVETNTNLHEERKEDMGLTSPQSPASSVCLCFCFFTIPKSTEPSSPFRTEGAGGGRGCVANPDNATCYTPDGRRRYFATAVDRVRLSGEAKSVPAIIAL